MYWDSDYWPATTTQAYILRLLDAVFWKLFLLPWALLGVLLLPRRLLRRAALPCAIILASLSVPVVFWAQTRFRLPFVPFFIVLAAGAAAEATRRLHPVRTSQVQQNLLI
jgi:hypothetical protein